ncbi:MAG: hypothetical protein HN795_04770 [Flavobacteriaceae bacterium]|nr:hypothetical protein [Flavobacteriaceae bacterium]
MATKGYVVSSDESGNFYKEIYLQDDASLPSQGIKVVIDRKALHNKFNIGREVYINLSRLYVGEVNTGDGVVGIGGGSDNDELTAISEGQGVNHILRSQTTEDVAETILPLAEITDEKIGMFVTLRSVHFLKEDLGHPLVASKDWYDTKREINQCAADTITTFLLETSRFADFSDMPIPSEGVSIRGIITKTYNGSDLVVALNRYEDIDSDTSSCMDE